MPHYFFDIENGDVESDDIGTLCRDLDEVRAIAVRTLTGVAGDEATHSDRFAATVVARDETGYPVLVSTLTLTGTWLCRGKGQT